MTILSQLSQLSITSTAKIVLVIMDGLGGLPYPETHKTELETAQTPNLDRLAKEGICGLTEPVTVSPVLSANSLICDCDT